MESEEREILEKIANTIRQLSMEAVQKANSGHPGLPLGCAEIGSYLYGKVLRHNPKNPDLINRDRLVLSAGHGSMWLYSCLHLSGFALPLEELKRFRQLHSLTQGHPEYPETPGVEFTTGPLGQGIANSVGLALGLKMLARKFNTKTHELIDAKVYCLAGDGCLQEGISSEASSFAGHMGLDNLVLIFDSNHITLDGPLSDSSSEDVGARYRAYGWDVVEIDGNDLSSVEQGFNSLQKQTKPTLVIAKTIIGKGSPNKANTHKVHGAPLGEEELKLTKEALGLPEEEFFIPQAVRNFFQTRLDSGIAYEKKWDALFKEWKKANPDLAQVFETQRDYVCPDNLESLIKEVEIQEPISGRKAAQAVLTKLGDLLPFLYGGSADLSGSDCTMMAQFPIVRPHVFEGRNFKFGIREFAMAAMAAGLFRTHMIFPFVGTFLTFSDYMRNAIRLAALSRYHVIYQFTHDSIFLGEDGPTHQSIEHVMALRAIPQLQVIRPCDANEVKGAWMAALKYEGPTALIFTRQNLPSIPGTDKPFKEGVGRGAYIVKKEKGPCDFTLFATGSEVSLAMDVAHALENLDKHVRVVSMPCWELFVKQESAYRESVVGGELGKRVSIEAGVSLGWERWIGPHGIAICMEGFGLSAPASDLAKEFGFTVDAILNRLLSSISEDR